jgi:hypothetical protein
VRRIVLAVALPIAFWSTPAQADNVVSLHAGYFAVRSLDSRPINDVIYSNAGFLAFEPHDFDGFTFGGDWLFGIGRFVEAGVGVGYYQQSVDSTYWDYVDSDGSEIFQEMKLRQIPVNFTARVFPFGRGHGVEPYFGGGVAIVNWRYSEVGEFVDFNNHNEIFRDQFVDEGNTAAPVVLGGLRVPIGDGIHLGGEFRWQGGEAELDPSKGFSGDVLDLGGYTGLVTFQIRF